MKSILVKINLKNILVVNNFITFIMYTILLIVVFYLINLKSQYKHKNINISIFYIFFLYFTEYFWVST